jgi:hypothetical protein
VTLRVEYDLAQAEIARLRAAHERLVVGYAQQTQACRRLASVLRFVDDGLEHIIATDDCERCAENVKQSAYLSEHIKRELGE